MHQFPASIDVRFALFLFVPLGFSHGVASPIGGQNQLGGHLLLHRLGKLRDWITAGELAGAGGLRDPG